MNPEVLLARLDERQQAMDAKLDLILTQVNKTNGRVDGHDTELKNLNNWKHEVKGNVSGSKTTLFVVGAIVSAIISIAVAIIFR